MKNDEKYPLYLIWLDEQLKEGKLNRGTWSLRKMSRQAFDEFKQRLDDGQFENKVVQVNRDSKIDDLFDGFDFD
jgi:hypothetical protein